MNQKKNTPLAAALVLILSGCGPASDAALDNAVNGAINGATPEAAGFTDVTPDASNAALPLSEKEPEGAQTVLDAAIRLAEAGRFDDMKLLWREGEQSDAQIARIVEAARAHPDARAVILGPGTSEGAAGTIYMTFPVAVRLPGPEGEEIEHKGTVTLRRVNDVPGANEAQLSWRISDASLDDSPAE